MKKAVLLIVLSGLLELCHAQWSGTNPLTTSSRVGVGPATPSVNLEVSDGQSPIIKLNSVGDVLGNVGVLSFQMAGSELSKIVALRHTASGRLTDLQFFTGSSYDFGERLRIKYDGNIGIGTSTPKSYGNYRYLTINGTGGAVITLQKDGVEKAEMYHNGSSFNIATPDPICLLTDSRVGIGTPSPNSQLHLASDQDHSFRITRSNGMYGFRIYRNASEGNIYFQNTDNNNNFGTRIKISEGGGTWQNLMLNPDGGNVLIGKTAQTETGTRYKLDVEGSIRAHEIVVNTTGADFVFEPAYQLMSLQDLENYLKANRHLPGIAPAAEMQENGVSAGEMQTKLLQKQEETVLYLIEMAKQIDILKKENDQLKTEKDQQLANQQKTLDKLVLEIENLKAQINQ